MGRKLTMDDVVRRLKELGYFKPDDDPSVKRVSTALRRFQRFHGFPATGEVDDATSKALLTPYRCGSPDTIITDAQCRWPIAEMPAVTYYTNLTLSGVSKVQAAAAYDIACKQWEAVCGIRFKRVTTATKANIAAKSGLGQTAFLDGRGGTLAWSYMPCGARKDTKLSQMFDQAERWSSRMLLAVACHEIGHAIGLPHGRPGQLMAPYYNADVVAPQAQDIVEVVKLYGPPQTPVAQKTAEKISVKRPTTVEIRDALDDSIITTLYLP
jgi:hypothetical protein